MLLWGLHLGYPVHSLQHIRWVVFGRVVPVYYFFTVLPMAGAAGLALSFRRHWIRWELLWWMLPLACVPGILHSGDRLWSARQWLSWAIRGVIPGGILFIADRKKSAVMLMNWIYPIIIAASLLGFWELYYNRDPLWGNSLGAINLAIPQPDSNPFYRPEPSYNMSSWSWRPGGTQGNRIVYASTLVGFLPLGFWLLKYKKIFYPAHIAAVGILSSMLLLAQTRAVWVGTLVAVMLMQAVGLLRGRREAIKIAAGVFLCLGIFLAWPPTQRLLWPKIISFQPSDRSIRERLEVFQTLRVLKDRWLFGVGFGQFPTACKPSYPRGLTWNNTPDDQYLRWTIENGIAGSALLAAFFVWLIRAGWKKIKLMTDIRQADFYKSLLVGWSSVAVTFLFFDGFYWGACNMTFWCFLGLFATCLSPDREAVDAAVTR